MDRQNVNYLKLSCVHLKNYSMFCPNIYKIDQINVKCKLYEKKRTFSNKHSSFNLNIDLHAILLYKDNSFKHVNIYEIINEITRSLWLDSKKKNFCVKRLHVQANFAKKIERLGAHKVNILCEITNVITLAEEFSGGRI